MSDPARPGPPRGRAVRRICGEAGAQVQVFLLPYAGGGAGLFWPWAEHFAPAVQVFALQAPGREDRFLEPPVRRLAPLVEQFADELVEVVDRPWMVFGHSLGAVLAYELVRALVERGVPDPAHLFVSGSRPPHLLHREGQTHLLPDAEFIDKLRQLRGTPPAVLEHEALMELMMPMLRADFAILETYEHITRLPLHGPVTALSGLDDEPALSQLERWGELVDGPFDAVRFPGGHFYIHEHRRDIAELVNQAVAASGP